MVLEELRVDATSDEGLGLEDAQVQRHVVLDAFDLEAGERVFRSLKSKLSKETSASPSVYYERR